MLLTYQLGQVESLNLQEFCFRQLKQNFMESVDVMEKREAVSEVEALCERPFYRSDGDRQKSDVIERIQKKRKIRCS